MSEKLVNSTPTISPLVIDDYGRRQQQDDYSVTDIITLAFETGLFFAVAFLLTHAIKKINEVRYAFSVSRHPTVECLNERSQGEHGSEIYDDSP
jgi:hypothetical protein